MIAGRLAGYFLLVPPFAVGGDAGDDEFVFWRCLVGRRRRITCLGSMPLEVMPPLLEALVEFVMKGEKESGDDDTNNNNNG